MSASSRSAGIARYSVRSLNSVASFCGCIKVSTLKVDRDIPATVARASRPAVQRLRSKSYFSLRSASAPRTFR